MKRVAIFADIGNLYYCLGKKFGKKCKLDYRRYMDFCREFGEVYQAHAYCNQTKDEAADFMHCLQQIGFDVKPFEPEDDRPTKRVKWNCGIAVDIVNLIDRVDAIILGSGDGDLEPIAQWARQKGVTVIVIAAGISRRLKKNCTKYVEVSQDMLEEAANE